MSWLSKILGHDDPVEPWECIVIYADGTRSEFRHWARDLRHAMELCVVQMPISHVRAERAEFRNRQGEVESHA